MDDGVHQSAKLIVQRDLLPIVIQRVRDEVLRPFLEDETMKVAHTQKLKLQKRAEVR